VKKFTIIFLCNNNNNNKFLFNNHNKTHFMINIMLSKTCRLWDNVEKYCRAGQTTDDGMAHAHCMLETKATNTFIICNIYCFSTEKKEG